jgi:gluconolactonase
MEGPRFALPGQMTPEIPMLKRLATAGLALALPASLAWSGVPVEARELLQAAKLERWDPAFDAIVAPGTPVEKLAQGFGWAEGPVWIGNGGYLLFTDVPGNTMWRWSEQRGLDRFLSPSGAMDPDPEVWREAGANGLFPDGPGAILLADTGNRNIARLDLATRSKSVLAAEFAGRRFSSPNDVVRTKSGVVFFTDPPYGFRLFDAAPQKEQPFNGVYRRAPDGAVTAVDKTLTRPNGVALSPDERVLYVSQSEPARAIIMRYTLDATGNVTGKALFHDATDLVSDSAPGLPDGLTVAADGTVLATGPGGVLVLSAQGKRLGRISTGKTIANCKFGDDGRTLYLTSSDMLARIRLKVAGTGFAPR